MIRLSHFLLLSFILAGTGYGNAKIGAAAPNFSVKDANGKIHKLADFKGKNVVLEWYNKDCPYVRKHYDSGNMQKTQKMLTKKGMTWLTVVSSAKGKQGYQSAKATIDNYKKEKSHSNAVLLDANGEMGEAYGAQTTPHMYLVDASGVLRYRGAIDSNDSANPKTIKNAENYVLSAANSILKGEKVKTASTQAYGCGVKY